MAAVRITEQLQISGYLELSRNGPAAPPRIRMGMRSKSTGIYN